MPSCNATGEGDQRGPVPRVRALEGVGGGAGSCGSKWDKGGGGDGRAG